jgi:hypothetical protein
MEREMAISGIAYSDSALCTIAISNGAGATGGELSQNDSVVLDLDRLRTATVRARTRESAFLAQHIRPLSPNYSPSIAILGSDDGADRSSEVIRQPEQVETSNA